QRITLAPGERQTVVFSVKAQDLGSYDPGMHWVVPSGTYDAWVAPDAASGIQGSFEIQ
ncbi:MAG: fibronectin type III-like domain-contianing protein, partial [Acidobacteria bacterium]|nr:fibronectin type III-like domain-contianing protein [Acidobacteriota bacterium]